MSWSSFNSEDPFSYFLPIVDLTVGHSPEILFILKEKYFIQIMLKSLQSHL